MRFLFFKKESKGSESLIFYPLLLLKRNLSRASALPQINRPKILAIKPASILKRRGPEAYITKVFREYMTCMDALMSWTHGCAGVTKVGRPMRETWGSKGARPFEREPCWQ